MKKFLAIFAIAGLVFASCENSTEGTVNKDSLEKAQKDSVDAANKMKNETLENKQDSLGDKKDVNDSMAKAAKDSIDAKH